MRTIILIILTAVVCVSGGARAALNDVAVSLPLEGYYRPGELMPVRVLAPSMLVANPIELSADGAIRTLINLSGTSVDGVFPWLVYSDQVRNVAVVINAERKPLELALKPLAADERLIGIATAQMPEDAWLQALFPSHRVIPIRIANGDLTRGPVAAWGVLDALVIDASTLPRASMAGSNAQPVEPPVESLDPSLQPAPPGTSAPPPEVDLWDQRINKWLLEGITVVVRGGEAPEPRPIWTGYRRASGDADWIARLNVAGPRGHFSADAYAPVAGWNPGRSADFRRQLFLRAVCFAIIALAVALWKPAAAPFTMAGVVLCFGWAIAFWERRAPFTATVAGTVLVRHENAGQQDHWNWKTSLKPHHEESYTPIFASPEQAKRVDAVLVCQAATQGYVAFNYQLGPGQVVAEVRRQITTPIARAQTAPPVSPLVLLVKGEYLRTPGSRIEGQLSDPFQAPSTGYAPVEPDTWNAIVVDQPAGP